MSIDKIKKFAEENGIEITVKDNTVYTKEYSDFKKLSEYAHSEGITDVDFIQEEKDMGLGRVPTLEEFENTSEAKNGSLPKRLVDALSKFGISEPRIEKYGISDKVVVDFDPSKGSSFDISNAVDKAGYGNFMSTVDSVDGKIVFFINDLSKGDLLENTNDYKPEDVNEFKLGDDDILMKKLKSLPKNKFTQNIDKHIKGFDDSDDQEAFKHLNSIIDGLKFTKDELSKSGSKKDIDQVDELIKQMESYHKEWDNLKGARDFNESELTDADKEILKQVDTMDRDKYNKLEQEIIDRGVSKEAIQKFHKEMDTSEAIAGTPATVTDKDGKGEYVVTLDKEGADGVWDATIKEITKNEHDYNIGDKLKVKAGNKHGIYWGMISEGEMNESMDYPMLMDYFESGDFEEDWGSDYQKDLDALENHKKIKGLTIKGEFNDDHLPGFDTIVHTDKGDARVTFAWLDSEGVAAIHNAANGNTKDLENWFKMYEGFMGEKKELMEGVDMEAEKEKWAAALAIYDKIGFGGMKDKNAIDKAIKDLGLKVDTKLMLDTYKGVMSSFEKKGKDELARLMKDRKFLQGDDSTSKLMKKVITDFISESMNEGIELHHYKDRMTNTPKSDTIPFDDMDAAIKKAEEISKSGEYAEIFKDGKLMGHAYRGSKFFNKTDEKLKDKEAFRRVYTDAIKDVFGLDPKDVDQYGNYVETHIDAVVNWVDSGKDVDLSFAEDAWLEFERMTKTGADREDAKALVNSAKGLIGEEKEEPTDTNESEVMKGCKFNHEGVTWEVIEPGETQSKVKAVTKSREGEESVVDNKIILKNKIMNEAKPVDKKNLEDVSVEVYDTIPWTDQDAKKRPDQFKSVMTDEKNIADALKKLGYNNDSKAVALVKADLDSQINEAWSVKEEWTKEAKTVDTKNLFDVSAEVYDKLPYEQSSDPKKVEGALKELGYNSDQNVVKMVTDTIEGVKNESLNESKTRFGGLDHDNAPLPMFESFSKTRGQKPSKKVFENAAKELQRDLKIIDALDRPLDKLVDAAARAFKDIKDSELSDYADNFWSALIDLKHELGDKYNEFVDKVNAAMATNEEAVSVAQQQAAGAALAAKRGETDPSTLKGASKEMYDSMTEDELKKFAETEHKGLPDKKEEK